MLCKMLNNISLFLGILFFVVMGCASVEHKLLPGIDAYNQLHDFGLLANGMPLKLHLGCGEQHFSGYINIDYPLTEHTVQTHSGADVFADIIKVSFASETVDEIRSHHVFEHFDRSIALALLCAWHRWLKPDGLLVIEVPDFLTSAKMMTDNQYSYFQKQIILRHIFGSHEASWAIHCDGWYKERFEYILSLLGYKEIDIQYSSWSLIHNITVRAKKTRTLGIDELKNIAHQILSKNMVAVSEQKMFEIWCQKFDTAFDGMLVNESL